MKQNQRIILRDMHIPSAPALAADSIEELLHEDEVDGHNDALRHITTSRHASAGGGATVRYVQEARPLFRLNRRLGPLSRCRFFNALQVRGQGRALHVFFLRAFAVDS